MLLLRISATNVVRTAASQRQNHLCRGIFTGASLNTIGCAKLASSVGLVVFILCWSREGGERRGSSFIQASDEAVRGTSNSGGRTAALSISTAFSRSPRSAIGYPANPTHG